MLSRKLFASTEETDVIPVTRFSLFNFDTTPVKHEDVMSFVTPNIKRQLCYDSDEDSGLGMEDHTDKPFIKRKRDSEPGSNCKRRKSTTDIKDIVNTLAEDTEVLGDGNGTFALPTIVGKHQDLKSISPDTMADVLAGEYNDIVDSYRIIDCRYPYEFEGGHIRGAENKYLHEQILSVLQQPTSGRQILIFHCEFSSERGPKMLRFLRSKDRELNKENYPALNFPEVYLLEGGYKAFFAEHPDLCDPISYRPMLHSDYSSSLRHFRTKSKSWAAGEKRKFARKTMRF